MSSGDSMRVMHPLFPVEDGGAIPTSPLQMRVTEIPFLLAQQLNAAWHSRLPRFGTGFIVNQPYLSFGAQHGDRLYAIAIWSNPVARNLPQQTWLELRRMAIAPDAPKNTPSWMIGVMMRMIKKHRPSIVNLVSYSDTAVHTGTIYKAAGWQPTTLSAEGDDWARKRRPNIVAQSTSAKQRWEKAI